MSKREEETVRRRVREKGRRRRKRDYVYIKRKQTK